MQFRYLQEMSDEEIKSLWKDIYQIIDVRDIARNSDLNTIDVTLVSEWEAGTGEVFELEDEITMYTDDFDYPNFSQQGNEIFKYMQFMIAKGFSSYWKDNPYVEY